jgi:hypothetical protein
MGMMNSSPLGAGSIIFELVHFSISVTVRPREIVSSDFVKGLDTNDIIKDQSSFALPLTKSEAGLNLPGQDEKYVLN